MSNLPLRCENKALIGVKCMKVNDEERRVFISSCRCWGPVVLARVVAWQALITPRLLSAVSVVPY